MIQMSYYVIIRGPAGVGKTTISKLLADKINANVVNFDRVMEELGMDYIEGEKCIPLHKFMKADEVMLPKFKKDLEDGKNLILDGNFYHKEQIEDIVSKLDFPNIAFTLKAGLKECIERDRTRENGLGDKAISDVFALVSAFGYGIDIDTQNKDLEQIVNEIYGQIVSSFERS